MLQLSAKLARHAQPRPKVHNICSSWLSSKSRASKNAHPLMKESVSFRDRHARPLVLGEATIGDQTHGACIGKDGDTIVFSNVVSSREATEELGDGGAPFTVEYVEKSASSGQIPKTHDKRESRNNDAEILTGRAIDRSLRPLFPDLYNFDTQLTTSVQSFDSTHAAPPLSIATMSASAAIHMSDVPWKGPVGSVRVGMIGHEFVVEPTPEQMLVSKLDLLYAGTRNRALMVEVAANEVSDEDLKGALMFAQSQLPPLIDAQNELRQRAGRPKREVPFTSGADKAILDRARQLADELDASESRHIFENSNFARGERSAAEAKLQARLTEQIVEREASIPRHIAQFVAHERLWLGMRSAVLDSAVRCDGRRSDEIRPLSASVDLLASSHGSGLFTRGSTEVLCTATLGPGSSGIYPHSKSALHGPMVGYNQFNHLYTGNHPTDPLTWQGLRKLILTYEFPPYSTGEVGASKGPNRRAVGHGALAEKALVPVMPNADKFPYIARLACEVTSSNGSSSMASTCAGSLALMDAGVPIKRPVAGISVGLMSRFDDESTHPKHDQYTLLTDIMGLEDHYGDMDFKVTGTERGVTAVQLDVKLAGGVPLPVLCEAIDRAALGRLDVLSVMEEAISLPVNVQLKPHAPRVEVIRCKADRLSLLNGLNGRNRYSIEQMNQCAIESRLISEDDAEITIFGATERHAVEARTAVQELVCDIEEGAELVATVKLVRDFGCIMDVLRGREGLLHMTEISHQVRGLEAPKLLREGDTVTVKCIGSDPVSGVLKLSRKAMFDRAVADPLVAKNAHIQHHPKQNQQKHHDKNKKKKNNNNSSSNNSSSNSKGKHVQDGKQDGSSGQQFSDDTVDVKAVEEILQLESPEKPKKKRGRPKKSETAKKEASSEGEVKPKKKRGRPKKEEKSSEKKAGSSKKCHSKEAWKTEEKQINRRGGPVG